MRNIILLFLFIQIGLSGLNAQQKIHSFSEEAYDIQFDQTLKLSAEQPLAFYSDSVPAYYSLRFGTGTLLLNKIDFQQRLDTIQVNSFEVLFYGGRSDTTGLMGASIEARLWVNQSELDSLDETNSLRSSSPVSVVLPTQSLGDYTFVFNDTTEIYDVSNIVVGLYYSNVNDSVGAVSPAFTPDPEVFEEQFVFRQRIDSAVINYVRQDHNAFWEKPENVGGMLASLNIKRSSETVPTRIENVNEDDRQPEKITISNYPNPFNPSTTIEVSVEQSASYSIRILNVLGEVIHNQEVFIHNQQPYHYLWQAEQKASGVYIIEIIGSSYRTYHQVLLLK